MIPAKYQTELLGCANGNLIVSVDVLQRCLVIYPLNEWEKLEAKIDTLSEFSEQANRLRRLLINNADNAQMDKAHRILIPRYLREYANIDKNVVLVGSLKYLQLWSDDNWAEIVAADEDKKQSANWANELQEIII